MADWTFVNPDTGAALGAHAYGRVAAGTASTAWPVGLRYKTGQSGDGVNSNALVLLVSEDGGSTYRPAVTEFSLAITAIVNTPNDPLFTEAVRSLGRGSRWTLAPFRAGCGVDLTVTFTPDKRTGASETPLLFKLGVDPNVSFRAVAEVPDAPVGVLSGLGVAGVNEWITAPTLANDTDLVTLGDCEYVHNGIRYEVAGDDVALDQDDGDAVTLSATEEYVAVLSVGSAGTVTVTKGSLDTAGTAVAPAYPDGELPLAVVRVPYGGVIVTSTLLAVSGRCLVSDAGGLNVTVQPGRCSLQGYYVTPAVVQTLTLADDATSTVYMSEAGVANVAGDGIPLAVVVCASGDISSVTDARRLLGLEPIRLSVPGTETAGTASAAVYIPHPWALDSATAYLRVASAGATGSTDLDVDLGGDELAAGAIPAGDTSAALVLGTTYGDPGWLTVDVVSITSGGTQGADLEIVLWVARR